MRVKLEINVIWLVIILAIGILIANIIYRQGRQTQAQLKEYWENPDFKTDTVHSEKHYHEVEQPIYKITVPPQIVINYPDLPDNGYLLTMLDSFIQVTDSLNNLISKIDKGYIINYPTAHKLVNSYFNLDTLRFDFLNIEGKLVTEIYPVNYKRFNYQYTTNKLLTIERHHNSTSHNPRLATALLAFGGYDVFNKAPYLRAQGILEYRKINLEVSNQLLLIQQPQYSLQLGLGYRIK